MIRSNVCTVVFLACAGGGAACGDMMTLAPQGTAIYSVTPQTVARGSGVTLILEGSFAAQVRLNFAKETDSFVKTSFRVWAGEMPLTGVTYVDADQILVPLPARLAAGEYDIRVRGPDGVTSTLSRGLRVMEK